MKILAALITLLIAATGAFAQGLPTPFINVRSVSGQFVVFSPRGAMPRPALRAATNAN